MANLSEHVLQFTVHSGGRLVGPQWGHGGVRQMVKHSAWRLVRWRTYSTYAGNEVLRRITDELIPTAMQPEWCHAIRHGRETRHLVAVFKEVYWIPRFGLRLCTQVLEWMRLCAKRQGSGFFLDFLTFFSCQLCIMLTRLFDGVLRYVRVPKVMCTDDCDTIHKLIERRKYTDAEYHCERLL